MLDIFLRENVFTNRKKKYTYRSRNCGTITVKQFIREIANANTTVTEADTLALFSLLEEKFNDYVAEGYAVQLPMGTFRASAAGTTDSLQDAFLPSAKTNDHTVSLKFSPESSTKSALEHSVKCQRTSNARRRMPYLNSIQDVNGTTLTQTGYNEIIVIIGKYLKPDIKDPQQGIFLEQENGDRSYRISRYATVTGSMIEAIIDRSIPSGTYLVHVTSKPDRTVLSTPQKYRLVVNDIE